MSTELIQKTILDQINEHLPQLVAEQIRKRLEKADKEKKMLDESMKTIDELNVEINPLKGKIKNLEHEINELEKWKEKYFKDRDEYITANRDIVMERTVALVKEETCKEKIEFMQKCFETVFANNKYKYSKFIHGTTPVAVPNNSFIQESNINTTESVQGES